MATTKTTPHEFIQQTLAPLIAVASSQGVEEISRKNNLDFVTLLQPFSKSTVEGVIRDPSGAPVTIQPRVNFCDIKTRPPPVNIARSYFNDALNAHIYERTEPFKCGNMTIEIPQSTPWFDAWRNTYLQVQSPSDHEFTKHYVGCLIMVSSLDASPVEQVARINQDVSDMIYQNNSKSVKWFGSLSSILITYGFLHDCSVSPPSTSNPAFEAMKATYGNQKCFFLSVNSQTADGAKLLDPWMQYLDSFVSYKENQLETDNLLEVESAQEAGEKSNPNTPTLVHPLSPVTDDASGDILLENSLPHGKKLSSHGQLLSQEDLDRIVQFVNEFCSKALIPHFEQLILTLTDQISVKKGVSRSLFSATKRLFGTNKPGTPGHQISPTAIAYSSDSHELQLRKLGDLCFMIGLYNPAYHAYHSAKRDFYTDGAWLHYAGALEMASLAAFMTDNTQLLKKMIEYAEESISTYQTSSYRYNPFATRATLLTSECLKGRGLNGEAAKQLIRMSGEDSDLRSAVLLEQAAYCFLHSPRPSLFRKYAFHMVLAGNRYSKASHKNHSMRCYYQAHQVYESKNWSIAEDHILYTIGKHASQLKLNYNGFEALSAMIKRPSRQSPLQQSVFLKDYIVAVQNMIADGEEGVLSIPVADGKSIQVLLSVCTEDLLSTGRITASDIAYVKTAAENYDNDPIWSKLEERILNFTNTSNLLVFTPSFGILNDRTKNISPSTIVKGEPVGIRVQLKNPLHIPVTMNNVSLMFSTVPGIQNDNLHTSAHSSTLYEVTVPPDSTCYIMLMLTPTFVGSLQVTSIKYTLHENGSVVEGIQHLIPVPSSKVSYSSHEADRRLAFTVIKQAPLLHVSFTGLKSEFFIGEILPITIHLRNDGTLDATQVVLACSENFEISLDSSSHERDENVSDLGISLRPNEAIDVHMKLRPSLHITKGAQMLNIMIYYRGPTDSEPRYRLVRHSWPTEILEAFKLKTSSTKYQDLKMDDVSLNVSMGFHTTLMQQNLCEQIVIYSVSLYSHWWKLDSTYFQPE
ncbi:Trafficking protein particle complex 8, partial [Nesidiocoris tenuis]